jgi:hypothetical protein
MTRHSRGTEITGHLVIKGMMKAHVVCSEDDDCVKVVV